MQVKIKFIGVLSVKFGAGSIIANIDPDYESLYGTIQELTDNHGTSSLVILKNGRPFKLPDPIEEGDEFLVFSPISGG